MQYNAIQSGRLERWLAKLLGVRNGGILPTVAPELGAAVNLPMLLDTDLLGGYEPWASGDSVPAGGAGTFTGVQLVNAFADALVVVEISVASSGAATTAVWFTGASYLANPVAASTVAWRDTRRLQASFPLGPAGLLITAGTSATAPPPAPNFQLSQRQLPTRTSVTGPRVVLAPGGMIAAAIRTANQDCSYELVGYIRHIDPEELTV